MTTLADPTLSASSVDRAGPPAPLRPVRVAVAGCSRFGIIQAAATTSIPNVELIGLVESRPLVRREVRGIGFEAPIFDRLAPLLERARPDAVIVGGPLVLRPRLVREALEASVPTLSDRPLAGDLVTAESLALLARERNVPLAVSHALVFHPVFAEAQALLVSGCLGAPRRIRCSTYHSRVFDTARQGMVAADGGPGGVLAHEALDPLFYLIETFGSPTKVRATTLHLFGPLEDEAHVVATLASGLEIGLDASWSVPGYPAPATVLEFEGENGKLLASDDALEVDLVEERSGRRAGHTRLGLADLPQPARYDVDGEPSYLVASAFLAWVAGGTPPVHRSERTMRAQRVLDALYASARNGGAVTPLAAS